MKETYADFVYVFSSIAAMIVFSVSLFIYVFYKHINIYLVVFGLLMLGAGFIAKKHLDVSGKQ